MRRQTAARTPRRGSTQDLQDLAVARERDRQAGLLERHRRFLRQLGVDHSALSDDARGALGRLLDQARAAFEVSEAASAAGEGVQAYAIRLDEGPAVLTLEKRVDLAAGAMTLQFSFDDGAGVQLAASYASGPMRVRAHPEAPLEVNIEGAWTPLEQAPAETGEGAPRQADAAKAAEEGVGAFVRGALLGDFGDSGAISAIAGQTVVGFIPVLGQIADIRDLIAAGRRAVDGEPGAWLDVGFAVLAVVPGLDALKGGRSAIRRIDDTGDVRKAGRRKGRKGKPRRPVDRGRDAKKEPSKRFHPKPVFKDEEEARAVAEKNGWYRLGGRRSSGAQIYRDPKSKLYFSRDQDSHSGGAWKGSKRPDPKGFWKENRTGTYDKRGNWIKK